MRNTSPTLLLAAALALSAAALDTAAAQTQPQANPPAAPQSLPQPQVQPPPSSPGQSMQQSQASNPVAAAVEKVQIACSSELRNFCSTVTPGEGRLLLCMQAHEDKLGRTCEMSLYDASRSVAQAMHRVEQIANACWNDIRVHCASSSSVGQCMADKNAVLSQQCQAVVAAFQRGTQDAQRQQPTLIGLPIYSSDGTALGAVTAVQTDFDGRLQAVQADMGALLGLGASSVLIDSGDLEWRGDRIELRMPADQVRSVLQRQNR